MVYYYSEIISDKLQPVPDSRGLFTFCPNSAQLLSFRLNSEIISEAGLGVVVKTGNYLQ